jgi:hypothetical protein
LKDDTDYKVGYKRAPTHTRFQKGKSGNPSGRPKRTQSVSSLLDKELRSYIVINENGECIRITKLNAIIKRATLDALKGNFTNLTKLLSLDDKLLKDTQEAQPVQVIVNVQDMSKSSQI